MEKQGSIIARQFSSLPGMLHLGDRKPIEFTAPEEIEDETSSDD